MPRYVTRPKATRPRMEWDDDVPLVPSLTVDDHEAVCTGILDSNGDEIWRAPNPIGFGRDEDW